MSHRATVLVVAALLAAGVAWAKSDKVEVLVELFTSEGCSDCPPADDVMGRMERNQPVPGVEIVPLGFHVDYWNRLGWKDAFSSAEYSQRQRDYQRALKTKNVYTPQMIVDGVSEFVGSEEETAKNRVLKAARSPKAWVVLIRNEKEPQVRIRASALPPPTIGETIQVLLAITEDGLVSEVAKGENKGRTLKHAAVVRRLQIVDEFPVLPESYEKTVPVAPDPSWNPRNLRIVVFLQESGTRRVLGVASVPLAQNS